MAISISRYVSVNSAVLGAAIVSTRQLILNMFTVNPLIPPQTYITFTSAAEVGAYFGTTSEEYYRASTNYFNFVSKDSNTPALMQFSRWVNVAVAGAIFGYGANTSLSAWKTVTNGSLGLTIGSYTSQVSGVNFASATSLSAPAFNLTATTNSTTAVTLASTAGIYVGIPVTGGGIPAGTTVASFVADTSLVLSQAATTSATAPLTFLPSVAAILQNAVRLITAGGTDWTSATVSYSANNFQLVGGVVGAEAIAVQAGSTGTDISGFVPANVNLGWYVQASTSNGVFTPGAIWSQGSPVETITQTLTNSAGANNNFGSFGFCYSGINGAGTNGIGLNLAQYQEAALWNAALVPNVQFKLDVPVLAANVSVWSSAYNGGLGGLGGISGVNLCLTDYPVSAQSFILAGTTNSTTTVTMVSTVGIYPGIPVTGTGIPSNTTVVSLVANTSILLSQAATNATSVSLTFSPTVPLSATTQYPEQCDAAIEAATNYDGTNSVQNYMYQVFPLLRPSVTTDSLANSYDNARVNYIGQTQNAGQLISFYQRGFLQGEASQPLDSGVYANEQWLKAAVTAQIMNLLLASNYVPANNQGESMITGVMQSVIQQALNNGTISVGKTLTALQRADITSVTGNPLAWQQVQNVGYYLTVTIEVKPATDPVEYQARYTLIYSKNDVIRFVLGTDDLI